eukprot:273523_1
MHTSIVVLLLCFEILSGQTWQYLRPSDPLPDACLAAHFIEHQLLDKDFKLHPDFKLNHQQLQQLAQNVAVGGGDAFQAIERNAFITDCPPNSVVTTIENKLKTGIYVDQINERYRPHGITINMMKRHLIITENMWKQNRGNTKWVTAQLSSLIHELGRAQESYIMKPSYGSRRHGFQYLSNHETLETLSAKINEIFAGHAGTESGTPSADQQFKAIMVEETYQSDRLDWPGTIEIKLWFLFGEFYYGIVDQLTDDIFAFTFDYHCVARAARDCKLLDRCLPRDTLEYMVKRGRILARDLGGYSVRIDWFVGSSKFGTVLNEFAFPNDIESGKISFQKRRIIVNAFRMIMGFMGKRKDYDRVIDMMIFKVDGVDMNTVVTVPTRFT